MSVTVHPDFVYINAPVTANHFMRSVRHDEAGHGLPPPQRTGAEPACSTIGLILHVQCIPVKRPPTPCTAIALLMLLWGALHLAVKPMPGRARSLPPSPALAQHPPEGLAWPRHCCALRSGWSCRWAGRYPGAPTGILPNGSMRDGRHGPITVLWVPPALP